MLLIALLTACYGQLAAPAPGAQPSAAANAASNGGSLPVQLAPLAWSQLASSEIIALAIDDRPQFGLTLAVYDNAERLSVLSRRPDGNWSRIWSRRLPRPEETPDSIPRLIMTDLDGTGASEILVATDRVLLFAADDAGYELAWESNEDMDAAPSPQIGVGDFDGDGRRDLATLNYKSKTTPRAIRSLYVYCQRASAPWDFALAGATTFTDEHGYNSTGGLAVGDFTGAGRDEIAAGNDNGNIWLAALNDGQLAVMQHWIVPEGGAVGPGLCAAELDGKNPAELLAGTNGGRIYVYQFDAQATPRVAASKQIGRLAYGVAAADFNGDGLQEFLSTRGVVGYAGMTEFDVAAEAWQLRDGQLYRVWRERVSDPRGPRIADVDGDGRADVVVQSAKGAWNVLEPRW